MPQAAEVVRKAKGKLKVQMDELWSFVDHQGNKQWVWLALDADTREVIGCHAPEPPRDRYGNHYPVSIGSAPGVYSDDWEAYETVIPTQRHRAVGKDSGLTSDIARLNNTLRQRVSRLLRAPALSRRKSKTTSVRFEIAFMSTTA